MTCNLIGPKGQKGKQGPTFPDEGFSVTNYNFQITVNYHYIIPYDPVVYPYFNKGNFDISTGVYTVPITGTYLVNVDINFSIGNGTYDIYLVIGSIKILSTNETVPSGLYKYQRSLILFLKEDQKLAISTSNESGPTIISIQNINFSAKLLTY